MREVAGWGALTNLSIILRLQELAGQKVLLPHTSTVKSSSAFFAGRQLWLTKNAYDWCFPASSHPDGRIDDKSLAYLGNQMNAFVAGKYMEQGIDLTHLTPHGRETWEIRSYFQQPFLRLFGSFLLPRVLFATHGMVRGDLEPKSGPKWNAAIDKNCSIREEIFPGYLAFSGKTFKDYVG
jgi:hypothetical protein